MATSSSELNCENNSEVLAVLEALPSRKELSIRSSRTEQILKALELCKLQQKKVVFATFSAQLTSLLKSIIPSGPKPNSRERRKMWTNLSILRAEKLPSLWAAFLKSICTDSIDPLFMELVNDALFERLINQLCDHHCAGGRESKTEVEITEDEQMIMRYACGYVGLKLHDKFIKQHGEKAAMFVECIDQMYADGPSSSLLEYTREWVDRINRGGLFDVSDDAFLLFFCIEEAMREKLMVHMRRSILQSPEESSEEKKAIITFVTGDCDVQYRWGILADNVITEESDSMELLTHVVSLWLTIRGFSISKGWMEDYKVKSATTAKRKKSLRKELKKDSCVAPED